MGSRELSLKLFGLGKKKTDDAKPAEKEVAP